MIKVKEKWVCGFFFFFFIFFLLKKGIKKMFPKGRKR
jgi:hypothetical protein